MNPMPLRTVSPTEAESLSLLAQRAHDLPVPGLLDDAEQVAVATARVTLRPQAAAGQRSVPSGDLVLQLQWSGAQFMLVVPAGVAAALLRHWCEGAPLDGMPPGWRSALDHLLSDAVCRAVEALGRGRPELMDLQRAKSGMSLPTLAHAFELALTLDDNALGINDMAVTMFCDSLGLHLMAGLCQTRAPARQGLGRDALPYTLSLSLGWTELPASTLRGLRPGHLVFVAYPVAPDAQRLWLVVAEHHDGERGFIAQHEDLAITLLRGPMQSIHHTDEHGAAADHDGLQDIDAIPVEQLPVRLSFDCGSVTLTLAQVEQLAAGQVIPTTRAPNDYVSIRANGAVIGRGVLMQVDGRLAVSITQLSAPAADGSTSHEGTA